MNIQHTLFNQLLYIGLAIDIENEIYLLAIPFEHGCTTHTQYYEIEKNDYEHCLNDNDLLRNFHSNGVTRNTKRLYYSTFIGDRNSYI